MTLKPCTRCRAQTALTPIDAASPEPEPVAVALKGMPVAACEKGHRQFLYPDFPRRLVEQLMQERPSGLPAGVEKGLFARRYHCAGCSAELAAKPERAHTVSLDIALPETEPFRAELAIPVYRCTACAKEQTRSPKQIREHVPAALAHAFQAAGIPPG